MMYVAIVAYISANDVVDLDLTLVKIGDLLMNLDTKSKSLNFTSSIYLNKKILVKISRKTIR